MKRALLLPLLLLLLPGLAAAAEWRVSPIRVDLGREAKSGSVTVFNGPGGKLTAQLSAGEWSQDGEGKDRYAATEDLVFFPRILQFEPGQERVVRVGVRSPSVPKERAYRLFIEELPTPDPNRGTAVGVVLRFGVPVFVRPPKEDPAGSISSISIDNGVLRVKVTNDGNVHFQIRAVVASGRDGKGEETFRKEVAGWYLLPGASRSHAVEIPADRCAATARVAVEVRTDRLSLDGSIDLPAGSCPP